MGQLPFDVIPIAQLREDVARAEAKIEELIRTFAILSGVTFGDIPVGSSDDPSVLAMDEVERLAETVTAAMEIIVSAVPRLKRSKDPNWPRLHRAIPTPQNPSDLQILVSRFDELTPDQFARRMRETGGDASWEDLLRMREDLERSAILSGLQKSVMKISQILQTMEQGTPSLTIRSDD